MPKIPKVQIPEKFKSNWYKCIEPEVRDLVCHLRNNGINTICSCGHDMYITCQCRMDGQIDDIHNLLYKYFYDNKLPINYIIEIKLECINGDWHSGVHIQLSK